MLPGEVHLVAEDVDEVAEEINGAVARKQQFVVFTEKDGEKKLSIRAELVEGFESA
jgi:hypothetical protein